MPFSIKQEVIIGGGTVTVLEYDSIGNRIKSGTLTSTDLPLAAFETAFETTVSTLCSKRTSG